MPDFVDSCYTCDYKFIAKEYDPQTYPDTRKRDKELWKYKYDTMNYPNREFGYAFDYKLIDWSDIVLMNNIKDIYEKMEYTFQKIGVVKYDAFHEMGGKLSFALAMLDKENNGFVMNAIHSSDGCYTYVKEIVKGESYVVLGEEEKEALRQAVNSHNELER